MKTQAFASLALLIFFTVPLSKLYAHDYHREDMVECRSQDYRFTQCPVRWRDARLVEQLSNSECIRGRTWGFDRRGLWVDHGCAGRFIAAGREEWQPRPEWNHRFTIACESYDYRRRFCAVDVGGAGQVYLDRQLSNSACIEGRTWGWNRAGVWVDQGCAGRFMIDRRWR